MALQFRNEFLGIQGGLCAHAGIEYPVDDEQTGLLAANFLAQQLDDGIEPFLFQGVEGTDELNLVSDQSRIEKLQGRQVLEQPLMGFTEQRRHQHPAATLYVVTGQLIGQDGFASTRRALNDVGRTCHQSAPEQRIEPFDPRHQPLECLCHGVYLSSWQSACWSHAGK
ncbi:hypothetical protein D3C81_1251430 [compost metagenome]